MPVYVVDRDIEVRANVYGIRQVEVHLHLGGRDTAAVATGVPNANGEVAVRLHLPEAGVIYVLSGSGVLSDQRPEHFGGAVVVNERNELIIPTGLGRVIAESE